VSTLPRRLAKWLHIARAAEQLLGTDALFTLAVMDRESFGGELLHPRGPTGTGDKGHGRGLMQIDDRAHPTLAAALLCDGTPLLQHPVFNTFIGAHYLAHLLHRFDGMGVEPMLPAAAAYNAGPGKVQAALRKLKVPASREAALAALDPLTTPGKPGEPGNYVSDVHARRAQFVLLKGGLE